MTLEFGVFLLEVFSLAADFVDALLPDSDPASPGDVGLRFNVIAAAGVSVFGDLGLNADGVNGDAAPSMGVFADGVPVNNDGVGAAAISCCCCCC